jgi:hypothetical protein
MIDKREIIDTATTLGLNPHVVEKDYVLGWLLWGIYNHDALAESWIFKGGTCLKKCFFETYRFSEDLDFTLTDPAHINADFLKGVFAEIGERIYEETGVELPPDFQQFEIFQNPRGNQACQGRIGYQGPVSPRGKSMPRVKLDLTADERVVLVPTELPVFHPYSDAPDDGIIVRAYAYEGYIPTKVPNATEGLHNPCQSLRFCPSRHSQPGVAFSSSFWGAESLCYPGAVLLRNRTRQAG